LPKSAPGVLASVRRLEIRQNTLRRLSKSYKVRKRPGVEFELPYDSAHDGHEAEPASLFTGQVVAGRTI
jgi:hypothetical protein